MGKQLILLPVLSFSLFQRSTLERTTRRSASYHHNNRTGLSYFQYLVQDAERPVAYSNAEHWNEIK